MLGLLLVVPEQYVSCERNKQLLQSPKCNLLDKKTQILMLNWKPFTQLAYHAIMSLKNQANVVKSAWALNQNEFYCHEDGFKNRHIFQHFGSSSYLLGCFSSLTIFDCSLWKLISWIKFHEVICLTKEGSSKYMYFPLGKIQFLLDSSRDL